MKFKPLTMEGKMKVKEMYEWGSKRMNSRQNDY